MTAHLLQPRVGLLPLYLALYDRAMPDRRPHVQQWADEVARRLQEVGLAVVPAPICTVAAEFNAALDRLEAEGADLLVTLHLAYSPSGESAPRLARSSLPILMLDTTPQYDFGPATDPAGIMVNHGIHGVQDLASVLRRMGRSFVVEAGHLDYSDVLNRVSAWARAAAARSALRKARVARIGGAFEGMNDFVVDDALLSERLGPTVISRTPEDLAHLLPEEDHPDIAAELVADRLRFDASVIDPLVHRAAVRAGLALRRMIELERLTAVTMNFASFTAETGMPTVPFLEGSKAMSRGVGYAGENDVLTATFVGALARAYGEVSFTEMFCPDWKGGAVFLSHMGEINPDVAARKPLLFARPYPWSPIAPPAVPVCAFRPGKAVFANVAPGPDGTFGLVLAPVEMLEEPPESRYGQAIRGWMRPAVPLEDFLAHYSRHGGTHHAFLLYGDRLADLRRFAALAGLEEAVID